MPDSLLHFLEFTLKKNIMKQTVLIFIHAWKKFVRRPNWKLQFGMRFISAFVHVGLLVNFIILGLFLDKILTSAFPNSDSFLGLNKIVLYYQIGYFYVTFFLYRSIGQTIKPYLFLPINRRVVIRFLIFRNMWNRSTLYTIITILTFFFMRHSNQPFRFGLVLWIANLFIYFFIINLLVNYIRENFFYQLTKMAIVFALPGIFVLLDIIDFVSLSSMSEACFMAVTNHRQMILLPLTLFVLSFSASQRFYKKYQYLDSDCTRKNNRFRYDRMFTHKGQNDIISLILLELKLITRNKRVFQTFFIGFSSQFCIGIILLIQASQHHINSFFEFILICTGCFVITSYTMAYNSTYLSWRCAFFDLLATSNLNSKRMIYSQFIFNLIFSTIGWLVGCFIIYFLNRDYIYYITFFYAYNIGITIPWTIYDSLNNTDHIQINETALFQFQDSNFSIVMIFQTVIVALIFPILIIFISRFVSSLLSFGLIAFIGIVGIFIKKTWIRIIVNRFNRKKHEIAAHLRGNPV